MTIGIDSNNPGNIRASVTPWLGQTGVNHIGMVVFDTPEHGIRAMARIVRNYQLRYGLYTVDQIVNRWAPPTENNTDAYVQDVATRMGISPTDWVSAQDTEQMIELISALIWHENGEVPYDHGTLQDGVEMAQ